MPEPNPGKIDDPNDNGDTVDIRSVRCAAYLVGRIPPLIAAWQFRFATGTESIQDRPWKEMFYEDDSIPRRAFDQLDSALRVLAQSAGIRASILVELHRSMDAAYKTCEEIAELSLGARDAKDSALELFWDQVFEVNVAQDLAAALFDRNDECRKWIDIGLALGIAMRSLSPPLGYLEDTRLLTAVVDSLDDTSATRLKDVIDEIKKDAELNDEKAIPGTMSARFFREIAQVDHEILQQVTGLATMNVLTIDHQARELRVFEQCVSFDEFRDRARQGLAVFFVLAEHPSQPIAVTELCERAGTRFDVGSIYSYVSKFRSVVLKAIEHSPAAKLPVFEKHALRAFVVDHRKKRKPPEPTRYSLALAPEQVKIIPMTADEDGNSGE